MGKRFDDFRMALEKAFEDGTDVTDDNTAVSEVHSNSIKDKPYRWFLLHLLLSMIMLVAIELLLAITVSDKIVYSTWFIGLRDPVSILVSFALGYIIVRGVVRLASRN